MVPVTAYGREDTVGAAKTRATAASRPGNWGASEEREIRAPAEKREIRGPAKKRPGELRNKTSSFTAAVRINQS